MSEAYARQLKQLLPRGALWFVEQSSWLSRMLLAIGDELARIDDRGADLLNEWDPRTALETLSDWERVLGLPDGCVGLSTVTPERQAAVTARLVARGGSTASYFVGVAASMGYVATVDEPSANTWRLNVDLAAGTGAAVAYTFRAGSAHAGDRVASLNVAVLECVMNRIKPAHTTLLFLYTS